MKIHIYNFSQLLEKSRINEEKSHYGVFSITISLPKAALINSLYLFIKLYN